MRIKFLFFLFFLVAVADVGSTYFYTHVNGSLDAESNPIFLATNNFLLVVLVNVFVILWVYYLLNKRYMFLYNQFITIGSVVLIIFVRVKVVIDNLFITFYEVPFKNYLFQFAIENNISQHLTFYLFLVFEYYFVPLIAVGLTYYFNNLDNLENVFRYKQITNNGRT